MTEQIDEAAPAIVHRTYQGGQVHSLVLFDAVGCEHSLNALLPGTYDFGVASRTEVMTVMLGRIRVKGAIYNVCEVVTLTDGDPIRIEALEPSAYICSHL